MAHTFLACLTRPRDSAAKFPPHEMHRNDLRELSRLRLREARLLLRGGAFQGAYYLTGYAVECALKACIASRFRRHDIPERNLVNDLHTHNLQKLLEHAGLRGALDAEAGARPALGRSWDFVKDWRETARYNPRITRREARVLYFACASRRHGVLPWLKRLW